MRVHVVVPVLTLLVGLAVGYGVSLLVGNDARPAANSVHEQTQQASPRENTSVAADPPRTQNAPEATSETTGEPKPEPLPVERVDVSGLVVDTAGEPVPGLRFRWTPATPTTGALPLRANFSTEAEWRAALRARLHRGVDLRVEGITDIVSDADGRFRIPDSVSPNGTLELLDPEWMTLSATVSLPIRPENIVRVSRAAELEVSVDVEGGQPARKGRVQMRYKNSKLGYWSPPAGKLPAMLRVPAGEAVVELLNLDIGREAPPATVVLDPGKRTRLAIVLPQRPVLVVRVNIPPGNGLTFGLRRAQEGLTDEEIANAPGGGYRQTENGIEFAVDEPGEYVFFCRALKTVLDTRRLRLERGRTDIALTLTPPPDWRRLLLRISTDGKPLNERTRPQVYGLSGLVWERHGGDFTWLVPPDNRGSIISVQLDKFGELAAMVNPASRTVDFAFVTPVTPRLIVRGARAEVRGNASIQLMADSSDGGGYHSNSHSLRGSEDPVELSFSPMQPGRYRARLLWNAGVETMGQVIELGVVDVAAGSVHTLDLPAVFILTVVLPAKSVRGSIDVKDANGGSIVMGGRNDESGINKFRFLTSGNYVVHWTDMAGTQHKHNVQLNADTVVRPLGD